MNKREFLSAMTKSSAFGAATLLSLKLHAKTGLDIAHNFVSDATALSPAPANRYWVYIGTYTGSKSKGIYGYRYETKTMQFTSLGVQAEIVNPSWLATGPPRSCLYAISEVGNGQTTTGQISSFSINRKTGALTFLNKVSTRGGGPCHLTVDRTGKVLLTANYGSGSVASFAIKADGSIGEPLEFTQDRGSSINPSRQSGPHCHEVVLSPDNRFLLVPELGLDQIKIYRFSASAGKCTPNNPPFVAVTPGYGPRHLTFGVDGNFAYLVCEMKSSVMTFSYDRAHGSLKHLQTISTLPPDFAGIDNSAEIQADRSGRFLYASNRGHDSIAVFAIDRRKGTLSPIQVSSTQGKTPRNFVFDPAGDALLAANQDSDQINVFNLDHNTGRLMPTDIHLSVPSPVCIHFVPAE